MNEIFCVFEFFSGDSIYAPVIRFLKNDFYMYKFNCRFGQYKKFEMQFQMTWI